MSKSRLAAQSFPAYLRAAYKHLAASLKMSDRIEGEFNQAAARVSSSAVGTLSQDEQLGLYGLYSVARKGPAPQESPSALLDLRAYAKWNAWRERSHLTREEAMSTYTEFVKSLSSVNKKATNSKRSAAGIGNTASSGFDLSFDGDTSEQSPDLCYWAATGDVAAVLKCLEKTKISPDYRDQDNLTPLMRAADRNEEEIVDILVSAGADLDVVDDDGQSALHYAVYCEHEQMAALLAAYGASLELRDRDGLTPVEAASPSITAAFEAVKTGTWKRTSKRHKRAPWGIPFIPALPISYRSLAALAVMLLAAVVAMWRRN